MSQKLGLTAVLTMLVACAGLAAQAEGLEASALNQLGEAAGPAAQKAVAAPDATPEALALTQPIAPKPQGPQEWAKGRFDLGYIQSLGARTISVLDRIPAVVNQIPPSAEAAALMAELKALAQEYGSLQEWTISTEGTGSRRIGWRCVQQGPWADRVFYVTETWRTVRWEQQAYIVDAVYGLTTGLRQLADEARARIGLPGSMASNMSLASSVDVAKKRVESLGLVAADVYANGLKKVEDISSRQSRHRERDGEGSYRKEDCPHNGVY